MSLRRLRIRHFRGVARLDIDLEPLTVAIGENACGKSSLLDAVAIVLGAHGHTGASRLRAADVEHDAGSPVMLAADLALPLDAVDAVLGFRPDTDAQGRALLRLVVVGARRGGGGLRRRWRVEATVQGRRTRRELQAGELAALQAQVPVLLIRHGRPVAGSVASLGRLPAGRRVHALLDAGFDSLGRQGAGPGCGVTEGARSARRLAAGLPAQPDALPSLHDLVVAVSSALGTRSPANLDGGVPLSGQGSAALAIASLHLCAALLWAREACAPDAPQPLVMVESPESGLHPLLLASAWRVLEGLVAQRLVATESGAVIANVPLPALRRITGDNGRRRVHRMEPDAFHTDELRKLGYHVRARRGDALFARCWLLVEGESEFWYLPGFAGLLGLDLAAEGVACIEFAQCGVRPLIQLADALGIGWHVVCDGDSAGATYARVAAECLQGRPRRRHISRLGAPDIEHLLWDAGYRQAIMALLAGGEGAVAADAPERLIQTLGQRVSKPALAMAVLDAARATDGPGVPPALAGAIEACVAQARGQGDAGAATA
ncbi:MAG: ATP-dependent nuclease [Lysobacteraceae bacterium]